MITSCLKRDRALRPTALLLTASLTLPTLLAGCGGNSGNGGSPPPAVDDTHGGATTASAPMAAPRKQGMSTKTKVVLLVGAAALYYMYKKHQKAQAGQVQYYLSKNGRVYYRDPQTHQAHWVTPPQGGVQVPADEAQQYSQYKGYNNSATGRDLSNMPEASADPA